PLRQPSEDRPPSGLGQGRERAVQPVGCRCSRRRHSTLQLNNLSVKYSTPALVSSGYVQRARARPAPPQLPIRGPAEVSAHPVGTTDVELVDQPALGHHGTQVLV